jgi:DNA-binding NtrC family response regulator/tetratricopeptide (TPR) repeat protein
LSKEFESSEDTVVDLSRARARLRGNSQPSQSFVRELDAIEQLLDAGNSLAAVSELQSLISSARNQPEALAQARLSLSIAQEMHGQYKESLAAISMYEAPDARTRLPLDLALRLRAQIALAYNYTGEHPKAIAILNTALKEHADEPSPHNGVIHAALAKVYRTINEYPIARDYSERAKESYRQSGDWRGLAESYFGIALADQHEGHHDSALANYEQALQLIGDHKATFLLGKIYANMAGVCRGLKQPLDGIKYLEKAIGYYEQTDHKILAAKGHNNLGINLVLVGQWDRARQSFEQSLSLLTEVDEHEGSIPMALDSLGELHLLRGDLPEARNYLERAVAMAAHNGNKWYEGQALRTLARCYLAMAANAEALGAGNRALAVAERIGDRQAILESKLLLAESNLALGDAVSCSRLLGDVSNDISDASSDIAIRGETDRLLGSVAIVNSDTTQAIQHFGRCVSIFDLLGDRYRTARAHLELGRAYMLAQSELAGEHLSRAVNIFRELGARRDLEQAEAASHDFGRTPRQQERQREAAVQLITLRLAEAVASRALLLRELAAVIRQETTAARVMIIEPDEEQKQRIVVAHGYEDGQATAMVDEISSMESDGEREGFARKWNVKLLPLKSANSLPITLIISPADSAELSGGLPLEPLLRVAELGMDVCALRARTATDEGVEHHDGGAGAGLLSGFIHSSPAMTRLVEEVNKIRSSDVTVLVTGESGTGKELVARAIHALSARRDKLFVPFNCTAVPKELSESYLFGHRRGAFTGAVTDSSGVIRSAAGGTLFIDEVGDLPLDVQPKLLRFLQEGEIQPLGEQKPMQIDVRIIAATNTDLEDLVAQGRFREDLYYRLNVIRLRVPPLRERRSEIPAIVNYYINHYSSKFGRHDIQITPQAVDLMMVAEWPGNVRQVCNEVQRIVARAENGTVITPEQLSPELRQMGVPTVPASVSSLSTATANRSEVLPLENVSLAEALEGVERRMITEAMRRHKGNITRVARELGLTRRGLYLKLDRYNIRDREGTHD